MVVIAWQIMLTLETERTPPWGIRWVEHSVDSKLVKQDVVNDMDLVDLQGEKRLVPVFLLRILVT